VRGLALRTLAHVRSPPALNALAEAYRDPQQRNRNQLAQGIAAIRDPRALAILKELLEAPTTPDAERRRILYFLSIYRYPERSEVLVRLIDSQNQAVRSGAIMALSRIAPERAVAPLRDLC